MEGHDLSDTSALMSSSDASFKADAIDHLATPPTAAERRGLALALIAAAALHLVIPLAIVLVALFNPRPAPPVREIPVEIVVEKPPQPPKPPEQMPKPPPQPDDERPAYDAPSAATPEKANRDSPDTKTSAPEAKPEATRTAGAPQESKEPPASQDDKTQAAPSPKTPPVEHADHKAAPTPAAEEADSTPAALPAPEKPAPTPAPPTKAPPGAPPPSAEVLPEPKFAHAATESPIAGGSSDSRYFTIVYGMIKAHLREPRNANLPTRGGAIMFELDEGGNLLDHKLVSSSGSPNLDMAVMNAIAEAAPYPAPPGWQPKALRLTFGR